MSGHRNDPWTDVENRLKVLEKNQQLKPDDIKSLARHTAEQTVHGKLSLLEGHMHDLVDVVRIQIMRSTVIGEVVQQLRMDAKLPAHTSLAVYETVFRTMDTNDVAFWEKLSKMSMGDVYRQFIEWSDTKELEPAPDTMESNVKRLLIEAKVKKHARSPSRKAAV